MTFLPFGKRDSYYIFWLGILHSSASLSEELLMGGNIDWNGWFEFIFLFLYGAVLLGLEGFSVDGF